MKNLRIRKISLVLLVSVLSSAPFVWEYLKKEGIHFSYSKGFTKDESTDLVKTARKAAQLPPPVSTEDTVAWAEEPLTIPNILAEEGPLESVTEPFAPDTQKVAGSVDSLEEGKSLITYDKNPEIILLTPEKTEPSSVQVKEEALPLQETITEKPEPGAIQFIELNVQEKLEQDERKMIKTTLRFFNPSEEDFTGKVSLHVPAGVRTITEREISLRIKANESLYVPVILLAGDLRNPGSSNEIRYILRDEFGREVNSGVSEIGFKERISLQLTLDQPVITVVQFSDSLTLAARVHNRGNVDQLVTVVMSLQLYHNTERRFFELKGNVSAGSDRLFELKIWPRAEMFETGNVQVYITAMHGPEKQVFGNAVLNVQSVISSRRFVDHSFAGANLFDNQPLPQDITMSYRSFAGNSIYQIMGGGHVNLPAGNLSLQGLIYKSAGQREWIGLNTRLMYQYNQASFALGNINEQLEYSLMGRGVKAVFSEENRKNTLKVGLVDNQFNLFSQNAIFQNGYSFYLKDEIGEPLAKNRIHLSYLFRDDAWEAARHHMSGADWYWKKGNNWRVLMKSYGAVSSYYQVQKTAPSGAAEIQYSGSTPGGTQLAGNYYHSSRYFPGNRRGLTSLQQSVSRNVSATGILRANGFYTKVAPGSYQYAFNMETEMARLDLEYYKQNDKKFGVGVGYQRQYEYGNYNYLGTIDEENAGVRAVTNAHRLVEYLNWSSTNNKYSMHASVENGLVQSIYSKKWDPQLKLSSSFNLGPVNLNGSYQYGGYFLSEQKFAHQFGKVTQRLIVNGSINKTLAKNKLTVAAGGNYNKDFVLGNTSSGFANLRYKATRNYELFVNNMVYRYAYLDNTSVNTYNRTFYNIEAGLRISLNQARPEVGKKSRMTISAFYDTNSNGIMDDDEMPAPDYMMQLDGKAFITDSKGRIVYSSVPFGVYRIPATARNGWFNKEVIFQADDFREEISVPLYQAGTVRGQVEYAYNKLTARDFVPKVNGISLKITRKGEEVQRVVTNNEGEFLAFLPSGEYSVELLSSSDIDSDILVLRPVQQFTIESGKMTSLEPFVLQVKDKQINIRRFVQNSPPAP